MRFSIKEVFVTLIGPIGTYDNYSAAARTESKTALSCLSSFVSKKSGQTGDNIDILKKLNNLDSETISSDDPLAQKFKLLKEALKPFVPVRYE
ncbi:MAG TPA: hypothetical protein VHR42_06620, partial [Clostridia bacterium]|nr:hypothetical protein [Clostridia bacterium]